MREGGSDGKREGVRERERGSEGGREGENGSINALNYSTCLRVDIYISYTAIDYVLPSEHCQQMTSSLPQ